MAKYLDYDGLSKLWSKIGDHFVKKTGNKSETVTGDKKFTGTTTIGGTNIYSATAQVLGTNQNVTSFSGNKILFKNGATFEGTALDAGLCTRGICGTDTGGTSKSELYLNYDGNNNYSRKVVLGAGGTGESLGTGCGYTYCAVRGDEMKKYVTSLGYTKNTGTVTSVSVKINGVVKGTVTGSGTIDLGTYLTSHQSLSNYVTLNTAQTITGVKTFNAPKSTSGEQATAVFKTANGGQIILGKEGPNSGSMIALDQVAGTRRLNFRASATPGAIVWSQPESNSSLYYDVTNVYFRECTYVSFDSASTIRFNKFTNASALGTDANGNLKKVSLAKVATSGSYNDLSNKPAIPDISGKADKSSLAKVATSGLYNDLSGVPTLSNVARTGSYNDLNNKPNAVTYSNSGSNYYLWAFGGRYKISAPGSLQGDGTYKDVTIITSENLSSQGLFVPMVGTGSTPMSGDIQIKGEYEGTNASSGPIAGGSGQTHTSPRNADLSLGLKGISYHFYGNDNTYGSSGNSTFGLCYKSLETAGGSYSNLDYLLDAGLNIFYYGGQSSTNPALSNVRATTITYDGKLTQREGTDTYIKSIKNLMEKMEIKTIDGSGWSTAGYVKDAMTGLMICYGTTPQISGSGNAISFSATFKGAPSVIVSPYFKSYSETSIVAQYRNSATIRCYVNSNGTNVTSTSGEDITKFILDTGNGEKQYFHYVAIGQYK